MFKFVYLLLIMLACPVFATDTDDPAQLYLEKYLTYALWAKQLPTTADPAFLAFIEPTTPLTQKLRDKWLYSLAQKQDWYHFNQYYRPSNDLSLRCHAQSALYHLGHQQEALQGALPLWLSGQSQPAACDALFSLLLKNHHLNQTQIDQRIKLALAQNAGSLALYLLKQSGASRAQEAHQFSQILQNPKYILTIPNGSLSGDLYLYGMNLLVSRHIDTAVTYWHKPKTKKMLSDDQQQRFLAHIALYKAMRHEKDAAQWFEQVKPAYCNDVLREWEIRNALTQQHWSTVKRLTATQDAVNDPKWQYWHARALAALGQPEEAKQLYQTLAAKRTYYGFLASIRLHQPLHFENEPANQDAISLEKYKPVTDEVANLYHSNQAWLASRVLNDFSSELPKADKSSLAYWVANHLHWFGKTVYLSSKDDTLFNQLSLRFPVVYQPEIQRYSQQYHIAPPLIYAMIRQESTFFEDIKSNAGAYGLMQVLPRTAHLIAKHAKIAYNNPTDLFRSEKNIHIGVAYLQTLSKQFHAHPLLMAAAYNAGPKQASYWQKNHPPKDIDIWIETLPWQETRNYLKNVIAFYAVYQYRMHQQPNLDVFLQPF